MKRWATENSSVTESLYKEKYMLRDRRELLEHDIKKLQAEAANMYLSIVIGNGDINSAEYQKLKEQVSNLQFDLKMVNQLIDQGKS